MFEHLASVEVSLGDKLRLLTITADGCQVGPDYPFQLEGVPGTMAMMGNVPVLPADERLRIKLEFKSKQEGWLGISCKDEEELRILLERRKYIDLSLMTENVQAIGEDGWVWMGEQRAEREGRLCLALVSLSGDAATVLSVLPFYLHKTETPHRIVASKEGLVSEESLLAADHPPPTILASSTRIKQLLEDDADKDDGPVFLASIQQIERSIDGFRRQIKLLLRALQAWMEAQEGWEERWAALFDCIAETACLETSLPYLSKAWPMAADHRNLIRWRIKHEFIDPLLRLYEHEIKVSDMRRREFEDAAAAYHAYEARYLKKDAGAPASRSRLRDRKFQVRASEYELKRMEYWAFLQDLQLAQSHRVNALLVRFLELLRMPTNPVDDVESEGAWSSLHRSVTRLNAEIERRLEEREQRHKLLEDAHDEALIRLRLEHMGIQPPTAANSDTELEPSNPKHREGFLNLLRPENRQFKRYWCVLAAGQVFEYSIDRERRLKLSEVFSLENCTVREARDHDRRFCLEVISPQANPARLYQARGEEEKNRWLRALQAAAVSWLDGTRSPTEAEEVPHPNSLAHWSSMEQAVEELDSNGGLASPRSSFRSPSLIPNNLLEELRSWDELNRHCADCGRLNPEWISINLGVIICIECSGIHRSLGSHISKIRSLTLDTAAFTPQLVRKIREAGGNLRMNAFYEARLGLPELGPAPLKPEPTSPHALKEQFIRAKYERLLWIPNNATDSSGVGARSSLDDLLMLSDNEK